MSENIPTRPGQQHKKGGRWHVRGLIGLLLWLLIVSTCATQYVAWRFAYHPALGAPWFSHFYAPWDWLPWSFKWYGFASTMFATTYVAVLAAIGLGFLVMVITVGVNGRRNRRNAGIHGTAHWADATEVRETGLLPMKPRWPWQPRRGGQGVYVGGWTDKHGDLHYLRHNGPEHVIAVAPTRAGKGVSLVVPTLLSWPASCVIHDQKGELWHLTAGWRSTQGGNVCIRFNPAGAAGQSAGFNPLEEVRIGTINEAGDVQNLATIMVDPEGKGLTDHWAKTAHAFLSGVILHLLYKRQAEGTVASLPDVAFALSDPAHPVDALYDAMIENQWDTADLYKGTADQKHEHQHPIIAAAAADMKNRPEEERGSVLSTAMSFLSLYRDPLIAKNVAKSDFKIADLMDAQKPVSLYLTAREEDKDRLKPLLRLMLNQIVRGLLRTEITYDKGRAQMPHKHRLLLMLDEFPSFGKLEVFEEALAYVAGYGIKAYLIVQDVEQLTKAYGKNESITSNCHVRTAFAPNKLETAKWLSQMTGTTTVLEEESNYSGNRFSMVLGNVSTHRRRVQRPLMTADEVMRLDSPKKDAAGRITDPGALLVFTAGNAPVYGTQTLYFLDPTFTARAGHNPPAVPVPEFERAEEGQTAGDAVAATPPDNTPAGAAQNAAPFRLDATAEANEGANT